MRQVTEALRTSEMQMRQMTDTVPAIIAYVDAQQRIRFHNRACQEAFGLTHAQLDGMHMRDSLGKEFYEKVRGKVDEVMLGYPVVYERTQKMAHGDVRSLVVNYFPRYGEGLEDGQVIGFYVLATDVTELKRMDRLKSEFITTVSHEVRPALLAMGQTLAQLCQSPPEQLPAAARQLASDARNSCERLSQLVSDMLAIEKIRAGKTSAVFE